MRYKISWTNTVSIPVDFDFKGCLFVVKEEDKLYFIEALTVKKGKGKGKGKDFPEVDTIEIVDDTISEAIVEFIS